MIFVTTVGGAYWAWSAYSERRLAAAIADIRARGEPAVLADFLPPESLPDDRNGAIPLKAAADELQNDDGQHEHARRQRHRNDPQNQPHDRGCHRQRGHPRRAALRRPHEQHEGG